MRKTRAFSGRDHRRWASRGRRAQNCPNVMFEGTRSLFFRRAASMMLTPRSMAVVVHHGLCGSRVVRRREWRLGPIHPPPTERFATIGDTSRERGASFDTAWHGNAHTGLTARVIGSTTRGCSWEHIKHKCHKDNLGRRHACNPRRFEHASFSRSAIISTLIRTKHLALVSRRQELASQRR
jgi:hypothetical protein